MSVTEVTDLNHWKQCINDAGSKAVLMDFHATWCGPCKMIAPFLKELAEKHTNVVFLKVDVDDLEDIAREYKVEAMPTFKVLKNGQVLDEVIGASKDKLEAVVKKYD